MKITTTACLLTLAQAALLSATLEPHLPPGTDRSYKLAFAAEFNDPTEIFNASDNPKFTTGLFRLSAGDLNTTRRLGHGNHELQLYLDEDFQFNGVQPGINPFRVEEGILTIVANKLPEAARRTLSPLAIEGVPAPLYSSGLLSTETSGRDGKGFTQLFGYWEMRAKLPSGKGLWSAFWLVTETHDYWDEVDIFEVLGHEPDAIYHSTHFHDGGGTEKLDWEEKTTRSIDTSDGFHIYGAEITAEEVIYYIDGVETLRVAHTLETPLYTIINLAVGGDWPGSPDQNTGFPAEMKIDYLRIYEPTLSTNSKLY